MSETKPTLAILVPVYNEERVVSLFYERLRPVVDKLSSDYRCHVVFLNNASTDGTIQSIEALEPGAARIFFISLARNVGYQRSLEFGLKNTDEIFTYLSMWIVRILLR